MTEWKVIDANYLRIPAPELESFLQAESSNRVVFNEYACIESYKGNALENIRRSMEVVCRYARQVVVLKGAMEITNLQSRQAMKREDFVDNEMTNEFGTYCARV